MTTKKIIIVLGMHRSGTSALTRGLSTMGVTLGDSLHPAGPDNPTGFWEDSDVIAINNQLLGLLGSAHDRMGVIDANLFDIPEVQQIYETTKALVTQKTASTLIWGMKDPRITRLLPFWKKLLNELGFEVGYAIVLRNPLNVAASLAVRNQIEPTKSYMLWLEHMLQAVAYTQAEKRLVVGYDDLLNDPHKQLQRISIALDLKAPTQEKFEAYAEEFLDKGLRHGQHNDDELLASDIEPPLLVTAYQLLRQCAVDQLNINSVEFDEQLAPLMLTLRRMLPMLQLVSKSEAATISANEGIVARDRQIEAMQTQINHLPPALGKLEGSLAEQTNGHNTLKKKFEENQTALDLLAAKKQSFEKILEENLAELDLVVAQKQSLEKTLEENQAALALVGTQKQSLESHANHLAHLLHAAQTNLLASKEQVNILSEAWATFFISRTWRLIRLAGKTKGKPVIRLPNGIEFDDQFYLNAYPDVKAAGISAREHFLGNGLREGRIYSAQLPPHPTSPVNVEVPTSLDVPLGNKGGFDSAFYLAMYPDIANCGMDPEQHFLMHGQHEGRIGLPPKVILSRAIDSLDNSKQTVLLVSHEASRTGAPILSLNIAQQLIKRFNVVVLLLGPGTLIDSFVDAGAVVVGPLDRSNPISASLAFSEFLDHHRVDFAIVNSLESNLVLKPLADRYIPSVSLIHEFAVYTRPRTAIQNALLWASQTVFSSDVTLGSATQVLPQLLDCALPVLAQGKSTVPGEVQDPAQINAEKSRLQHAMRPLDQDPDTIIILGAGRVQVRKGVDIFIECATRVLNSPVGSKCRFVWIGDNYDPEVDIAYSVYLYDQIQRSGIAEQFSIISETAQIEEVYAMSDMLLLSSRLDPLPNVAIDAMVRGLPVMCFDRTTGIADILKRNDLEEDCIAPYLDTRSMADKIIRLASSDSLRAQVGEQAKIVAAREFNMSDYVEKLVDIAARQSEPSQFEKLDTRTIEEARVVDINYYSPAKVVLEDEASAIRRYVRSWSRGVLRRKLFPGFEPGIYQELNSDAVGQHDPLAHFLRAGRPLGPWNIPSLKWEATSLQSGAHTALLFISVALPDQLLDVLDYLAVSGVDVKVVVLASDEATRLALQSALKNNRDLTLEILLCERGRLSTLLTHLVDIRYQEFDIIGHIDLQAEPVDTDFTTHFAYHRYLIENMIGGELPALKVIAEKVTERNSNSPIGLVFPADPNINYLSQDTIAIASLSKVLGLQPAEYKHQPYPVNGIFWCSPATLSPLVSEILGWKSAVKEQHLSIEVEDRILARMLPLACTSKEMTVTTTVVTGVTY